MDLERRIHEAILNSSAIRAEMDELQSQKIDRENELNVELAKMKEQSETELDNLNREIDALKKSFDEDQRTLKKSNAEKESNFRKIQSDLQTNIAILESTNELLKKEKLDEESEFQSRSGNLQQQISKLNEEEKKLKDIISNMKFEADKLSCMLEDSIKSKAAGDSDLFAQLNVKNTAIKNLEEQLKELKIQLQTQAAINTKISTEFRDLEEEQVDLVSRKEEYKAMCGDLSQELERLDAEKNTIQETLESLQQENALYKEASIKSESEFEIKYQEIKTLNDNQAKENEKITLQISNSDKLFDDLKNDLNAKSKDLQKKSDEMQVLEKDLKRLSDEQVASTNLIDSKETQIVLLNKELLEKTQLIQELNEKQSTLNKCLTDQTGNVSAFKDSVAREHEKLQTELADQNQKCLLLEQKIKETEEILAAKELQLTQETSKNTLLECESSLKIQGLNQEIDKLEGIKEQEVKLLSSKLLVNFAI